MPTTDPAAARTRYECHVTVNEFTSTVVVDADSAGEAGRLAAAEHTRKWHEPATPADVHAAPFLPLAFADRTMVNARPSAARLVVGITEYGELVLTESEGPAGTYALTGCCQAPRPAPGTSPRAAPATKRSTRPWAPRWTPSTPSCAEASRREAPSPATRRDTNPA